MRQRHRPRPAPNQPQHSSQQEAPPPPKRSSLEAAVLWAALLIIILQASWFVYYFQCLKLPRPVSAVDAGKRGFSEERAYKHVKVLENLGPHPVGSEALDRAVAYVLSKAEEIQAEAPWDVDVEVDFFHARPGVNHLVGGLFKGRSLVYANLKHVVVRVKPASVSGVEENAILVSSHIDSVISAPGAGDCSSNIAVMLELVRAISHWGHGFKHSIIFLFNTGEEEGLDGAHGFITQHPWRSTIRAFIDLEAIGIGGKSTLFQGGPEKWMVEAYARAAVYPSAQISAQDVFLSGFVKSATDFQVYKEVANLSGLDFAYMQNGAVYHTRNDKIQLLTPGSLQHLGDNMLALLREVAVSNELPSIGTIKGEETEGKMEMVYFDILGKYLITYSRQFAKQLNTSFVSQAFLLFLMSLFQGGLASVMALLLSVLALIFTWVLSVSLSVLIGIALPYFNDAAVPYIAHPWLAIGLFGAPALIGALLGHHLGHLLLKRYLLQIQQRRSGNLNQSAEKKHLHLAVWDAERWLFKAGLLQWLTLLAVGTWFDVGSSYIALLWLISPALAYGLIDATYSSKRDARELRTMTLLAALTVPLIASAGSLIRLFDVMIGNLVRFDRNPGATPDWVGNVVVAVMAASTICLFLVYLLPYAHRSGGTRWILCGLVTVLLIALSLVFFGTFAPFTEHIGRAVNVVQVVELNAIDGVESSMSSYVSLSSVTPGKLTKELSFLKGEDFSCGEMEGLDMVTHNIKYGCISSVAQGQEDTAAYFNVSPSLSATSDKIVNDERVTSVFIYTAASRRWVLAINTTEVRSFQLAGAREATGQKELLASRRTASSIDGWHFIQFVTDQKGPSYFELTLFWSIDSFSSSQETSNLEESKNNILLKLRTDVNITTPKVQRTLEKLPDWVVVFGKSTSPYPLSYLLNLPVHFSVASSK